MPSLQPEPELREEFARRRTRQLVLIVPVGIALVMVHFFDSKAEVSGLVSTGIILGGLAVVLGGLAFSVWNWRCPSCDGYLGRSINPRHCSKCGFKLRE